MPGNNTIAKDPNEEKAFIEGTNLREYDCCCDDCEQECTSAKAICCPGSCCPPTDCTDNCTDCCQDDVDTCCDTQCTSLCGGPGACYDCCYACCRTCNPGDLTICVNECTACRKQECVDCCEATADCCTGQLDNEGCRTCYQDCLAQCCDNCCNGKCCEGNCATAECLDCTNNCESECDTLCCTVDPCYAVCPSGFDDLTANWNYELFLSVFDTCPGGTSCCDTFADQLFSGTINGIPLNFVDCFPAIIGETTYFWVGCLAGIADPGGCCIACITVALNITVDDATGDFLACVISGDFQSASGTDGALYECDATISPPGLTCEPNFVGSEATCNFNINAFFSTGACPGGLDICHPALVGTQGNQTITIF